MRQIEFTIPFIQVLGALIGTEGVSPEVKKEANEQLEKLLKSIIKPSLTEMCAQYNGLLTKV
jgi:hypothetical protein